MYKCAFLGPLPLILDVNVGAGSRQNMTVRTVTVEFPETRVASVATNTIGGSEIISFFARSSLVEK
jgi:hypothetical protein